MTEAVTYAEAGFYYEEGGCWGMALALYHKFKSMGYSPELVIGIYDNVIRHGMALLDGKLYDHQGQCRWTGEREIVPTPAKFIERVLEHGGIDPDKLEADTQSAAEIITVAEELAG